MYVEGRLDAEANAHAAQGTSETAIAAPTIDVASLRPDTREAMGMELVARLAGLALLGAAVGAAVGAPLVVYVS